MSDPYTERRDAVRAPPARCVERWRHLGASVVIAGSIVGSGELVLTSTLGATGVNSAEICTYTYWCIEKGYARHVGDDRSDPAWPAHARGWVGVLQLDVWATLLILTCATLPFYLLGAGVLAVGERRPHGVETLTALSTMFTHTLGACSLPLFGIAAPPSGCSVAGWTRACSRRLRPERCCGSPSCSRS